MLTRITAVEFVRSTLHGRTGPAIAVCETPEGGTVEVVAKFSAGCDQGDINLAREIIGACLAADLGLPVPEPFLVDIPPEWIDVLANAALRAKLRASSRVAFGSRLVTGQFAIWNRGTQITAAMLPTAAAILVFDALSQNPDRRSDNPNCLVRGHELRIFDHELAFAHGLIIGWKPPWTLGGLNSLAIHGNHIFREGLRQRELDFAPIRDAWMDLSDARLAEYELAIPPEWPGGQVAAQSAVSLIKGAREKIDACLVELQRVLT
jgi:hypothetical protein